MSLPPQNPSPVVDVLCLRLARKYLTLPTSPRSVPYELLDIEDSSAPFETTTDDNCHIFTQLRLIPTIRLFSSELSRP